MTAPKPRIGESLTRSGLITPPQLDDALQRQHATGEPVGQVLVSLGYLGETDLLRTLCADAGIPFLAADALTAEQNALALVPDQLARVHVALPLRVEDRRLVVATADPFDIRKLRILEQATGRPIQAVAAPRTAILEAITRNYGSASTAPVAAPAGPARSGAHAAVEVTTRRWSATPRAGAVALEQGAAAEPSAADVLDGLLRSGIELGATDIHIEPFEDAVQVRYRVDGLLQDGERLSKELQPALLSRVKILAGLDIAEGRLPQDGRVRLQADSRAIDLRVSTFPTVYGEDVVLRILDRGRVALSLDRLGLEVDDAALLREALQRPFGMIAVTGPTGSGKTTTLYAALVQLNTGRQCILTVEDPVEYEVEGIRQSQINVRAGLTFASGLRAMLRHDPDTILVGEMRDEETVQIAISAALTGHLVLTTLHTTTAAGAIPRLLDMKAEPYAVASAVSLIVSQRLVRVLCPRCKAPTDLPTAARTRYRLADATIYGAKGCPACRQTGYSGRLGIFELLPITPEITAAIYDHHSTEEIRALSSRPTLLDDGLRKVRAGLTTLDEVLRVTI